MYIRILFIVLECCSEQKQQVCYRRYFKQYDPMWSCNDTQKEILSVFHKKNNVVGTH